MQAAAAAQQAAEAAAAATYYEAAGPLGRSYSSMFDDSAPLDTAPLEWGGYERVESAPARIEPRPTPPL